MNSILIIDKYYPKEDNLKKTLVIHSYLVTWKALSIIQKHPELNADRNFIAEAAMLHDIGIFLTDAPRINCFGTEPYIKHGYLGAELMRKEGYPQHAAVCERHTGTGISVEDIMKQNLPLPHKDFRPQTIEEQIICYADKFFSKTNPYQEKSVEQARESLAKFGKNCIARFDQWLLLFQ